MPSDAPPGKNNDHFLFLNWVVCYKTTDNLAVCHITTADFFFYEALKVIVVFNLRSRQFVEIRALNSSAFTAACALAEKAQREVLWIVVVGPHLRHFVCACVRARACVSVSVCFVGCMCAVRVCVRVVCVCICVYVRDRDRDRDRKRERINQPILTFGEMDRRRIALFCSISHVYTSITI